MTFEEYWNQYGELHASMCGGNIKQFAKEFWDSAQDNTILNDLKCCGNCIHRATLDMGDYTEERCERRHQGLSSYQCCDKWSYDGLMQESRTEGFSIKNR